jgi:hypothetical protein
MNKILIILICAVAGLGIVGLIVYMQIIRSAPTPTQNTPSTNIPGQNTTVTVIPKPTASTTQNQDGPTLLIEDSVGGTLVIKNIKKDPALIADTVNPGYYFFGTTSSAVPYIIVYIDATNYFNIVLNEEPLRNVREKAQKYLQEKLDLTEAELCKLKYMVSVPYSVNQEFSSVSLGFSFCPGAIPL